MCLKTGKERLAAGGDSQGHEKGDKLSLLRFSPDLTPMTRGLTSAFSDSVSPEAWEISRAWRGKLKTQGLLGAVFLPHA